MTVARTVTGHSLKRVYNVLRPISEHSREKRRIPTYQSRSKLKIDAFSLKSVDILSNTGIKEGAQSWGGELWR